MNRPPWRVAIRHGELMLTGLLLASVEKVVGYEDGQRCLWIKDFSVMNQN